VDWGAEKTGRRWSVGQSVGQTSVKRGLKKKAQSAIGQKKFVPKLWINGEENKRTQGAKDRDRNKQGHEKTKMA